MMNKEATKQQVSALVQHHNNITLLLTECYKPPAQRLQLRNTLTQENHKNSQKKRVCAARAGQLITFNFTYDSGFP